MKLVPEQRWLRFCRNVCGELSAVDSEEWAFEPERGWPSFVSESALLLTMRRQEPRVLIRGCFPRELWRYEPRRIIAKGRSHFAA